MNGIGQVWTHVAIYNATGPGYDINGISLFRGPRHGLKWAPVGLEDSKLHPAYLKIDTTNLNVILRLYNHETGQDTLIPMPLRSPVRVPLDSIDSKVE